MIVVVDASVAVQWFVSDPGREPNHDDAVRLLQTIGDGEIQAMQPIHWLVEVAGVLAHLVPQQLEPAIELLAALELPVEDDPETLKQAGRLAMSLDHHLFDTLYHAVALAAGGILVTADRRYYRKARQLGHIEYLQNWRGP